MKLEIDGNILNHEASLIMMQTTQGEPTGYKIEFKLSVDYCIDGMKLEKFNSIISHTLSNDETNLLNAYFEFKNAKI